MDVAEMRFVKLRAEALPGSERELAKARTELSPTGAYKIAARETDKDEDFVLLEGGMSWYSLKLFELVQ
jgi:hypothetical protein